MRDFTIQSGRVTFRVAGEFELDLTIGNEDPTSQFWFIDFRFAFEPSIAALPPRMLALIENKINLILGTVGLDECYRFLHEFVQTHKISEIREQAIGLSKGRWIGGLEVEQLNRSLSIQYWAGRNPKGPKSFILLGVHSGKHGDDNGQPRLESHLSIRWFRDGREMVDLISFDGNPVSAEELLKGVIARHVGHILQSTYDELRKRPIFANHEAAVSVCISANEPAASQLMVQMSHREHLTMNIDQVSGDLIFSPASRLNSEAQHRLNTRCNDPASEAFQHIENLRCLSIVEEVALCGQSVGWVRQRPPALRPEDIKAVLPRDTLQVAWFRRQGWRQEWSVVISVGMSGQRWFLIQTYVSPAVVLLHANSSRTAIPISINYPSGLKVSAHLHIPIKTQTPTASYAFMSALAVFAAGLVSQYTNLRMLHARRILRQLRRPHQPGPINLPSIYLRMSSIVSIKSPRSTKPWAHDFVKFSFQGLHYLEQSEATSDASSISREQAIIIAEARIVTPLPMAFAKLSRKVDRDIAYNDKTGCFAFRLLCDVGDSIVSLLVERLKSVHRLMELVEVLRRHEATLDCESISLGQICFSYRMDGATQSNDSYRAVIDLSRPSTPMRLELLAGNPHIRVLDSLSRILNSSEGLDGVAILLPITLPVLRAFESIETRWSEEAMLDKGEVLVSVRAIDNYVLRYKIRRSPSDSDAVQVGFQLRLMEKKGKAFWYMRRQVNASRPADELDDRLSQSVWAAHDKDWNPVTHGAIAIGNGAEQALDAIDQVMRSVAEDPTITIEPGRKAMHSSADALQSQQRSMPAPNVQSQQQPPQPQPRGMKRELEVVEID